MIRWILVFVLLAPLSARAQFVTNDRPGLAISADALPQGALFLEAAVPQLAFTTVAETDFIAYSFPVTVRYGLNERIELRAATSLYNGLRSDFDGDTETDGEIGLDIILLAAKIQLSPPEELTRLAVLPFVTIPTDDEFDSSFGGTLAAQRNLEGGFIVTGNATVSSTFDDLSDNAQGSLIGTGAYPLTPQVLGFVEGFFNITQGDNPAGLGLGAAYDLNPRLQLDAALYAGLTDATSDVLVNFGASLRL